MTPILYPSKPEKDKGAGPGVLRTEGMQDFHKRQQQDIQKLSQGGRSINGVEETRDLKTEPWLSAMNLCK